MYCEKCQHFLGHTDESFLVCPTCGRVNLSESLKTSIYSGGPMEPIMAPASPGRFSRLSHLKLKTLSLGGAGILLLALIIAGIAQNISAHSNMAASISLDKTGNYQIARERLKGSPSFLVLPSTKKQYQSEKAKNQKWLTFYDYQSQADKLVKAQKYDEALALLNKIATGYPTYSSVKTAIDKTKQLQTAAVAVVAQQKPPEATGAPKKTVQNGGSATANLSNCFAPTSINGKRFVNTAAFSSVLSAGSVAQVQDYLRSFFGQYGVGVEITSVSPSSYVTSYDTYTLLSESDLCSLKTYAAITVDEWAKYPASWIQNSGLKKIVLVKELAVQGQRRAATPDIGGYAMYYDPTYSGDYAREVLHHEFDHLIHFKYFNGYATSDPTWLSYNPPGFSYGNGGASCYTPGNCLTGEHPVPGFVTGYGTSAVEEDKAELYAYLMTTTYYHHLQSWLPGDSYLTNKVNNYKQFIASHSPEMSGGYFDQINP
jgi:hypothetical protein